MQDLKEPNRVLIEDRKRLSMTGVDSVDGFSEQILKLSVEGSKVIITGENIKINSFNKSTGNLSAEGHFNSVKYENRKEPLIKRILK